MGLRINSLKTCKKHGELNQFDLIKSGVSRGKQKYRCKRCMKELHRNHYQKNKEKVLLAHKKYNEKDKEKIRQIKNASKRKAYKLNPEKFNQKKLLYEKKNPQLKKQRQNKYLKKSVKELSDTYMKRLLTRGTLLKYKDIPDELIKFKREIIKLKRLIRKEK